MKEDDINDYEIRLIGEDWPIDSSNSNRLEDNADRKKRPFDKRKIGIILFLVTLLLVLYVVGLCVVFSRPKPKTIADVIENEKSLYDPLIIPQVVERTPSLLLWLKSCDSLRESACALKDTIVNDIPIRIYLPLNAHPALEIGTRILDKKNVILALQAADIRADNRKIVGAFVQNGTPLAWGLSKKGYCAILGDSVHIGMADNSPLFEEAVNSGGCFFRQYPLVSKGRPQENNLKSQSVRRALCDLQGRIFVVETLERSSMHDFSELLADMGVDNAVYLIGSDAVGTYTDLQNRRFLIGNRPKKFYKNTNFIYWVRS